MSDLPGGAAPRHVSPSQRLWRSPCARPLSTSCRGASPPAQGFPTGRDPGHIQGPIEQPGEPSRGSSRGTPEIRDLQSSSLRQGRAHKTLGEGSGHDQSGRSKLGSQQSPRHGLTRRCSGLASLAAELHSLGWAWRLAPPGRPKKGELAPCRGPGTAGRSPSSSMPGAVARTPRPCAVLGS